MPTNASVAAAEIAERLRGEGFEVTDTTVQRWREKGLLGRWDQVHGGGAGSTVAAPSDAFGRARIAIRLSREERTAPLITLLLVALGGHVPTADFAAAASDYLATVRAHIPDLGDGDPWDAAAQFVDGKVYSERATRRLRDSASVLEGTPDPQHSYGEKDRTPSERTKSVYTTGLVMMNGDASEIVTVLPDAARLLVGNEMVDDLGLDQPEVVAGLDPDLTANAEAMVDAMSNLSALTDDDLAKACTAYTTLAGGHEHLLECARLTEPFTNPHRAVSLLLGVVLSQIGLPGQLADGLTRATPPGAT